MLYKHRSLRTVAWQRIGRPAVHRRSVITVMPALSDITTKRLFLRVIDAADAEDVFRYCSDPDVARNTSWPCHRSVEDARAYIAWALSKASHPPHLVHHIWAIRLRGDAQVIGTVDLIQDNATDAHTDYVLARAWWNQGLMSEAVRAVTTWGFDQVPSLKRVHSVCLTRNIGSGRVLEKCGFRLMRRELVQLGVKFDNQRLEASRFELPRPEQ